MRWIQTAVEDRDPHIGTPQEPRCPGTFGFDGAHVPLIGIGARGRRVGSRRGQYGLAGAAKSSDELRRSRKMLVLRNIDDVGLRREHGRGGGAQVCDHRNIEFRECVDEASAQRLDARPQIHRHTRTAEFHQVLIAIHGRRAVARRLECSRKGPQPAGWRQASVSAVF